MRAAVRGRAEGLLRLRRKRRLDAGAVGVVVVVVVVVTEEEVVMVEVVVVGSELRRMRWHLRARRWRAGQRCPLHRQQQVCLFTSVCVCACVYLCVCVSVRVFACVSVVHF